MLIRDSINQRNPTPFLRIFNTFIFFLKSNRINSLRNKINKSTNKIKDSSQTHICSLKLLFQCVLVLTALSKFWPPFFLIFSIFTQISDLSLSTPFNQIYQKNRRLFIWNNGHAIYGFDEFVFFDWKLVKINLVHIFFGDVIRYSGMCIIVLFLLFFRHANLLNSINWC